MIEADSIEYITESVNNSIKKLKKINYKIDNIETNMILNTMELVKKKASDSFAQIEKSSKIISETNNVDIIKIEIEKAKKAFVIAENTNRIINIMYNQQKYQEFNEILNFLEGINL